MRKSPDENKRLLKLRAFNPHDKVFDATFHAIVTVAAHSCGCAASYISFIESKQQIFRAQYGISLNNSPRSSSICRETILNTEPLIITPLRGESRFLNNPICQESSEFDFYAGIPLITDDDLALGTLCVLDRTPRSLTKAQIQTLRSLASHVVSHLELHKERKTVQKTISSLEDSEERFRRIADASPVLLWISDETGNRTLSNKAWCDFTGLTEEQSLAECWRATLHPDDRDVYRAKWRECAATRSRFQHEFRLRHTSGTYRWVLEQAIPLFASNGRLEAYVSSCVDLSLRGSDELQYQHNEARFRAISEAAPLGIVVTDSQGNCIYSNHQFQIIAGLSAEQSLGSGWLRALHPEDRDPVTSAWLEATKRTDSFETTFRYLRGDESIAWCSLKAAAINSTDTVSGWVLTIEDITTKRHAETALLEAKQAAEAAMHTKSQFLANMSHEIRTPLTAIIGFAEALRDDGIHDATQPRDPAQQHCLEVILNNGKHLLSIINQILDLSKIDAGALTIEKAPCDIVEMLEDLRLMFAPTIAEKSLSLHARYEWPLPRTITTDPLRLKQVLINLLGNAIKFTERGGIDLRVSWSGQSQQVCISVSDTGIGMTPEQCESLFKPFCQANESITRKYGGTGLGLSISERLVKALGGTLHVQSELGRGTTLSFSVKSFSPINDALVRSHPTERHHYSHHPTKKALSLRGRILFADDALDNRRLVEHLLRKVGLDVVLVEDGREAINAASSSSFDLILMDVQMPNIDGLTATRSIREAGVTTPIVALSAGAMTSDVNKALEAGCSMHLSKPFTKDSLYGVLVQYLGTPTEQRERTDNEPMLSSMSGGDPDMLPLLLDFIDGLSTRIKNISSAYDANDFEALKALAHKLKGSAGMYGFPELSFLAGKLEDSAKEGDLEGSSTALGQIQRLLPRIELGVSSHQGAGVSR